MTTSTRHDDTQWLIHFVRDRDPEYDLIQEYGDFDGQFVNADIESEAGAFQVLKGIVNSGGLLSGYSFRKGRTTIYGGQPVVCATEMPIYSFAKYVSERGDTSKVSAYGVAFLKSEFFAAGGRHAIYGLSDSASPVTYVENTPIRRVLEASVLPFHEQYRYVAYNPTESHWIDWSHEREWRWIARDEDKDSIWCKGYDWTIGPTLGLPLFKGKLEGWPFTQLCLIVWTEEEAEELRELLTGLYLAGSNDYCTPFDRELIDASRIIVLKDVIDAVESGSNINSQTIEGLDEANLLSPISVSSPPPGTKEIVDTAFAAALEAGKAAADAYIADHPTDIGSCGFAWSITDDVTNPFVQYLLENNFASGPYNGRVYIDVHGPWPFRQSIDYHEAVVRAIAESLSCSLGVEVYMRSRMD